MGEEKPGKSPENPNEPGSDEKKSTRTFTQSEFDSALARETAKLREQTKSLETTKSELETLRADAKKREEAEMSEVQKSNRAAEDLKAVNAQLEAKMKETEARAMKADILSDSRFTVLPRAYRSSVTGSTADEITASAECFLKEYGEDMKRAGGKPPSFEPPPSAGVGKAASPATGQSLAQSFGDKVRARFSGQ